jgi:8-oxo-dGTP diphosphatase
MARQVQRVAAYNVCVDDQERLLVVRFSERTEMPGAWTLPGGGLQFGEHPEAGAIRELREETGLHGRIIALLAVDSIHRPATGPDGEFEYHSVRVFYRTAIDGGVLTDEREESTDAAAWRSRAELAAMRLVPTAEIGIELAFGA